MDFTFKAQLKPVSIHLSPRWRSRSWTAWVWVAQGELLVLWRASIWYFSRLFTVRYFKQNLQKWKFEVHVVKEERVYALILVHFFLLQCLHWSSHILVRSQQLVVEKNLVTAAAWIPTCARQTGGLRPCLETAAVAFKWLQLSRVAV